MTRRSSVDALHRRCHPRSERSGRTHAAASEDGGTGCRRERREARCDANRLHRAAQHVEPASGRPKTMTAETSDGLPVPRRYFAVFALLAAIVLAVLDGAIANVALPTMASALGVSPAASIWIVSGYQLALVVSLLPFSALGESIGYRPVFTGGVLAFTAASALMRRVAEPAGAGRRARSPGLWRRRHHGHAGGSAALHLSAAPARHGHRLERPCRGPRLGCGTDARGRDPGCRKLALALRHQYSDRRACAACRPCPAGDRAAPPAGRRDQRGAERPVFRAADPRRRSADGGAALGRTAVGHCGREPGSAGASRGAAPGPADPARPACAARRSGCR